MHPKFTRLDETWISHPVLVRWKQVLMVMLGLHLGSGEAHADDWPMRQRDAVNTGRAEFDVPANRRNQSFFDSIRWQKPSPGSPDEGRLDSGTMVFFDGAGPGGADIVVGGYHWPKGVQGMDRHSGKSFWAGNPDGGESIGDNTPAFSANGATIYVINDFTNPERPLMAFPTALGPAAFRHNGNDALPGRLSAFSPKVGPEGRIYAHQWNDRPHAATDNGSVLAHVWSAETDVGACYNVPQIWQDVNRVMVVSGGRHGQVKAWDGSTGSELWSADLPHGTDADATIDPANGRVYLPVGSDDVRVAGLDKHGDPLWGTVTKPVFEWQSGVTDPQRAQSAGCLSHDGLTYYFQTVSPNGEGKLYAINTADGSLKWSFATGSRGWERAMSSPIISLNGVIVVGNNEGNTYFALLDEGGSATLLDTLAVADSAEARNSATISSDGLLYLSGRWQWTTSNGDNDMPSQQAANLFTAFDLNAGAVGPVAPEITIQPVSQIIDNGTSTTLSVTANSGSLLTYQWYRGSPGDTSKPVMGATLASFTTPDLTDTSTYWVRVGNAEGLIDSDVAVIQTRQLPLTPISLAAALAEGIATASTSTLDIGSGANIFDGDTSTLARTQALNPMVVTLQLAAPLQLAKSRIYFGAGPNRWKIETADTLIDLDGGIGSYRLALDWQSAPSDQWHERLIPPASWCRFVRLSLERLTGDDYVHLYEWQLFSGTATAPLITAQPRSIALTAGQSLTPGMLVVGAGGSEPLTYRWTRYSGYEIWESAQFASQPQLALGPIDGWDEGIYRVEVSNDLGRVQSQEVVVGVNGVARSQQGPAADGLWVQIELEPEGLGAWRFEGESSWRASGEQATGLTAGDRTVVFKPVAGWIRPEAEIVTLGALPSASLRRAYLPGDPALDNGSLTFHIRPVALADPSLPPDERAQWRLAGEDDTQWSDSGAARTGLPEGEYLIECKELRDREKPAIRRITVISGETREATSVYPPRHENPSADWNLLDFTTIHTASEPVPYACVGRVSSDQTEGSGFQVAPLVVLTDASLVFDEGTLTFATRTRWFAERHRDIHEPTGDEVKNVLLMGGYTAGRATEATPGQLSPASGNLGVAAIRLAESPRFTGYLASADPLHHGLASTAAKRVVAYPSRLIDPSLRGRMHESAVSHAPLSQLAGGLYNASAFAGGSGIAGAPLLVRHNDGRDYPAGIVVGGGTGTTVRAIDSEVLRLILLTTLEGEAYFLNIVSNTGITITSWKQGSNVDPAALQVVIDGIPSPTIGRWGFDEAGAIRPSGAFFYGLMPGKKRISFPPVVGLVPPGDPDPQVPGGGFVDIDLSAGQSYFLEATYAVIAISLPLTPVVAGSTAVLRITPKRTLQLVEWFRDGVSLEGDPSVTIETGYNGNDHSLSLTSTSTAMSGTYVAKISHGGEVYWSAPALLTVAPRIQAIQWASPSDTVLDAVPVDLAATATSGLPVGFEVVSGPATLTGNRLSPTGSGVVVVRATQPGTGNYAAADPIERTFEFEITTPAAWRFIHFGNDLNEGDAADAADPDGDGRTNSIEFEALTNPRDASDFLRVLASARVGNSFSVSISAKPGRLYTLQKRAATGGEWSDVGTAGPLASEWTVVLTDDDASASQGLYRVKVILRAGESS